VLQGKNNQEIAELLHLGKQGVRNYVHAIYKKFHVTSRAELILLLHQQN
jgi:DNA-binding NarL/FixJ family response regulator